MAVPNSISNTIFNITPYLALFGRGKLVAFMLQTVGALAFIMKCPARPTLPSVIHSGLVNI